MQIEAQDFLKIVEKSHQLCFFDIEASGLNGDYNSTLVVSIKPYKEKPVTLTVETPGDDRALVRKARQVLAQYPLWVSFYGKGFDVLFLNTRLLKHNSPLLPKIHHVDMYWVVRSGSTTARRSQAHLLEFLGSPMQKMTLSPEVWNQVLRDPRRGLAILKKRCESDVAGLEALYERFKPLIREIQR